MKSRSLYSHSVFLRKKISPWLKWRTPWENEEIPASHNYPKPEEQLDAGHSGRSYCHNQQIDDVPQGDPHITYSNKMQVTIGKCEMEMKVLHGQILVQDARVYCHWRAHKLRKRSKRDGCLPWRRCPIPHLPRYRFVVVRTRKSRGIHCMHKHKNAAKLSWKCEFEEIMLQVGFLPEEGI